MEALLAKYAYLLLFFGVVVEGEAFLLSAALLAHRGLLHLVPVIGVAVAANTVADQIYYFAARARGRAWLETRYGEHPRYRRLVELMGRHGRWLLLASRYAFGFRVLIPAACGALGMPLRVFAPFNLFAGIVWAVPTALLGYFAGEALTALLGPVRRYETLVAVGLVVSVAAAVAGRHLAERFRRGDLHVSDLHRAAPMLVALMGVLNLVICQTGLVAPHLHTRTAIESSLPLEVTQPSGPLMLFAGIALLQVTRNLARHKIVAWWVATGAIAASLVLHASRDLHHSLVAGLLLALLLVFRRRYNARSDPFTLRRALLMTPVLLGAIWLYGYSGLTPRRAQFVWDQGNNPAAEAFRSGVLIVEPRVEPQTQRAARFLGSLQIGGWLARLYLLVLVLGPVVLRRRQQVDPDTARGLVERHGGHSLSALALDPDKHLALVAEGRGLVAYAVRGRVAFCLGDPLADETDLQTAIAGFLDLARRNGWMPCFYQGSEAGLAHYCRLGLRTLKTAEEAIVDLDEWSLAGGKRATLRAMVNKVAKMGWTVQAYHRAEGPDDVLDENIQSISEEWLAERQIEELGFSIGRFSLEALDPAHVFVARSPEKVEAFVTWRPYRGGRAAVLDLMRKRRDTVSGAMDLLLAHSLAGLKERGLSEASLANAPLANVGEPHGLLEHGVALLFERMNAFYGYKSLFQFKKKFAPRWEGRYLVYPTGADLPAITLALTRVHGAGGLGALLVRLR